MSGWITVPRSFFDGPAWQENRKFSRAEAVLDLYRRAQWEAGEVFSRGKLISLARGEQAASCRFLAHRWGWTKDTVARFLKTMDPERTGNRANSATPNSLLIRSEVRQGETVLILCNYGEWTISGLAGCDTGEPRAAPQRETPARRRHDKAKEGEEGKESRNQKEDFREEPVGTTADHAELIPKLDPIEDAVTEIWEASHPAGRRRSSKKEVRHELRTLRKDGLPPPGTFRRSLEAWKASDEWTRDGGRYIPAVHRWISGRKWEIPESDLRSTPPANGRPRLSVEEIKRRLGGRYDPEHADNDEY